MNKETEYKYLIERKDTHEWYCLNDTGYYGHTYQGVPFGEFPDSKNDWTNDATQAINFDTLEIATSFFTKMEWFHFVEAKDCEITEHEFVNTKKCNCNKDECCNKCNH